MHTDIVRQRQRPRQRVHTQLTSPRAGQLESRITSQLTCTKWTYATAIRLRTLWAIGLPYCINLTNSPSPTRLPTAYVQMSCLKGSGHEILTTRRSDSLAVQTAVRDSKHQRSLTLLHTYVTYMNLKRPHKLNYDVYMSYKIH